MSLRGHVFDKQLFHNEIYALFQDTFLDSSSGILPKFKAGNNREGMEAYAEGRNLYIKNGVACICGRFVEETDEVYNLTSMLPSGTNYCILVIEIDLSQTNTIEELNQVHYKILSNSSTYPTLTQQDITNTNLTGIYQFELARFKTDASSITDFSRSNVSKLDIDSVYHKFDSEIEAKLQELDNEIALIDGGTLGPVKDQMTVRRYIYGDGTTQVTLPTNWESDYSFIEFIYGKPSTISGNASQTMKSTGLIYAWYDNFNQVVCDVVENIYNSTTRKYTLQMASGKLSYNRNTRVVTLSNQCTCNIDQTSKAMYFFNNSTSGYVNELSIKEMRLYKLPINYPQGQ